MKFHKTFFLIFIYLITFSSTSKGQSEDDSLFGDEEIIRQADFQEANNIITGDVNSDGREDVIVLSYRRPSVVLYLNEGFDRFSSPIDIEPGNQSGYNANDAVVMDFDFDGDMDVLVGYWDTIRLFKNKGDHTFENGVEIVRNLSSSNLSLSDFDGDGNMDIISSSYTSRYIRIIQLLGDGNFNRINVKSVHNRDADLYDMDLDGDKDVIVVRSEEEGFVWHENLGDSIDINYQTKNFGSYLQEIIIEDENGDGIDDLFIRTGGGYSAFRHISDSSFFFVSGSGSNTRSEDFAVGNYDQENSKRVAIARENFNDNYQISFVRLNNGTETKTVTLDDEIVDLKGLANADLNNDGMDDLVGVSGNSGYAFWYKNLGNNTFSERKSISMGFTHPSSVSTTDLNGNGIKELAVISPAQSRISFLERNFFWNWIQTNHNTGATYTTGMSILDVNQDDILDLVYSSFGDDALLIKEGTGGGLFSDEIIISTNIYGAKEVFSEDFNNDGLKDVLVIPNNAIFSKLFINNKFGLFKESFGLSLNKTNKYIFEDVDENGFIDILSLSSVLFNQDGRNFTSGAIPFANGNLSEVTDLGFTDIDGDGDTDLVFTGRKGDLYWLNREGASSTKELILEPKDTNTSESNTILLEDFDNDNDTDILIRQYGGRNLLFFENLGGGLFAEEVKLQGDFSQSIEFISSDIDNNGVIDLIVSDKENHKISWFKNSLITTSAEDENISITEFELLPNYPNPFNPTTNIVFNLASSNKVEIVVYDVLGRIISRIAPKVYSVGRNEVVFDAKDISSGVYVYKVITNEFVLTSKFTVLK